MTLQLLICEKMPPLICVPRLQWATFPGIPRKVSFPAHYVLVAKICGPPLKPPGTTAHQIRTVPGSYSIPSTVQQCLLYPMMVDNGYISVVQERPRMVDTQLTIGA